MSRSLLHGPFDLSLAAWTSLAVAVWSSAAAFWRWRTPPPRRKTPGPWKRGWERVLEGRAARLGRAVALAYFLMAVLAPALAPHDPNRIGDGLATHSLPPFSRLHLLVRRDNSVVTANQVELAGERIRLRRGQVWTEVPRDELRGTAPSDWHRTRFHLLGTDRLGRDLLSRLLLGSRISLGVGLLAAFLAMTLGALVGGVAGWSGPRLDGLLMRFTDAVHAFPRLFLILLVLAVLPGSFLAVVTVLAITGWMVPCRLVRSQVLSL
ncbi:MAG: ABC transporter permease, partial [Acidobacteriota bacterium]